MIECGADILLSRNTPSVFGGCLVRGRGEGKGERILVMIGSKVAEIPR